MSTAVGFRFVAGRYHATPWEAHVNEAAVEWPPCAWRFLRALVAVWHRKVAEPDASDDTLGRLVDHLAQRPPVYRLPAATHTHARHYMPERSGRGERKVLVFDAFARIDPADELLMVWPSLELADPEQSLLARLLERLTYLGRAESWVEARLLDGWDHPPDVLPLEEVAEGPPEEGGEVVRLATPSPPDSYRAWRDEQIAELGLDEGRLNKGQRRLKATLPERLLDALRLDTEQVRKEGWSRAPGMRLTAYHRPLGALVPTGGRASVRTRVRKSITTARLVLSGRPLPRLEDTVRIGELLRLAAIRKADDHSPTDGEVPPVLSGHDMPKGNRHAHAFYLPEDEDDTGRLDHVLIHADGGLSEAALAALDDIRRIWRDEGAEWRVALEGYGERTDFAWHPFLRPSRTWKSVTPYLHPWFCKKGFGVPEQIERECRKRGLPVPKAEPLATVRSRGRDLRPVHFHRFRSRPGLRQPDTRGSFWRLTFPEPIPGPLALGFGCHFGLGTFRSLEGT